MKINIRDLLDNFEDSSVNLKEENVVSSERIKELTKMKLNMSTTTVNHKRSLRKRFITIAVAASLVTVIGIATYAGLAGRSLQDVALPSETESSSAGQPSVVDGSSNSQMISLQGFSESPEYKAAMEWRQFTDSYDQDRVIMDQYDQECKRTGRDVFAEKYGAYSIWSQEMADKFDEITGKYGLSLHKNLVSASDSELNSKFGTIMSDATYSGYYYEDGSFQFDATFGEYTLQLRRSMKGVFDTVFLNVSNIGDYEQWTFTTNSGKEVLLALSSSKALILADLDDSFVAVNVLLDFTADVKSMSRTDLENLANHIDFFIL